MNHTATEFDALLANLAKLPEKDRAFAADLCKKGAKYGLTPKQAYWFDKFYDAAVNGKPTGPEKVTLAGDGFGALVSMFVFAKKNLKHPKITLQTEAGDPVQLSLAGPRSRYEGQVQVTDGGPYGSNKYYGRVDKDGVFTKGYSDQNVYTLLKSMATDPVGTAEKHGKLTGRCCFCNRTLSDEKSTAVGYGPVCAAHFGLSGAYKQGKSVLKAFSEQAKEVATTKDAPADVILIGTEQQPDLQAEYRHQTGQAPLF